VAALAGLVTAAGSQQRRIAQQAADALGTHIGQHPALRSVNRAEPGNGWSWRRRSPACAAVLDRRCPAAVSPHDGLLDADTQGSSLLLRDSDAPSPLPATGRSHVNRPPPPLSIAAVAVPRGSNPDRRRSWRRLQAAV
jgi:hypothetical protein